MLRDLLRQKGT